MKRVCSIFSQVLQLIPRDKFEEAVKEHKAERHARGFSSWGQLVAMLFCRLAQAKSLREITEGLRASEGKLKLERGTMLVFDRGYTDYDWFRRLTQEGVYFVTRLKDNAACLLVEPRKAVGEGVVSDEIIALEKQAQADVETAPFLRRVRIGAPMPDEVEDDIRQRHGWREEGEFAGRR